MFDFIEDESEDFLKMEAEENPYQGNLDHKDVPENCVVVYPKHNELQIDCDTPESLDVATKAVKIMNINGLKATVESIKPSKSGNWHMTITVDRKLTNIERIALQACCGSDTVRELLSALRVFQGKTDPTLFFELKG